MEEVYKNIDEQLEMIKSKNILIKDEERARDILYRENYYNLITCYIDIFLDIKKSSMKGTSVCTTDTYFEEIYAVYQFDRELRNIMLNYISIVETNLKSCIANIFSEKYGTSNYLKAENFKDTDLNDFIDFKELIKKNFLRSSQNDEDAKKYRTCLEEAPLWILASHMTFGTIIRFYSLMKLEDKKMVSNFFQINNYDMNQILVMLNMIRNIAAHGNILFNVKLKVKYPFRTRSYFHEALGIEQNAHDYKRGMNDILAIIIILKRLLQTKEYKRMIKELEIAIEEVKEDLDSDSFENLMDEMGLFNTIDTKAEVMN